MLISHLSAAEQTEGWRGAEPAACVPNTRSLPSTTHGFWVSGCGF